jgi:hypothetical protein
MFLIMLSRLSHYVRRLLSSDKAPSTTSSAGEVLLNRAVIVNVSQGLANQMISYKAGRMIAELNNAPLILDNRFFKSLETNSSRNYQLHRFPIQADLSIFCEAAMAKIFRDNKVARPGEEGYPEKYAREIPDAFRLNEERRVIYFGFWDALHLRELADRFFRENGLLKELTLDREIHLASPDRKLLAVIEKSRNPVAVHVRRGDYATHDGGLLIKSDYYNKSIRTLEDRVEEPEFFVFSDDQDWCRSHITSSESLHFADWNTDSTGYRDLYLASRCRHFILSNESTFSHLIVQLSAELPDRIVITSTKDDLERMSGSNGTK